MSQPLTATHRIYLPYVISGVSHKAYAFCKITGTEGAWLLSDRDSGDGAYAWTLGAQRYASQGGGALPGGATYGSIELQRRMNQMWVPIETYTFVGTPGSGSPVVTSQVTLTLRDENFNKLKVVFLDTNQAAPQRWVVPTGGDTNMDAFVKAFIQTSDNANDPYHWMINRSGYFINPTPFVSVKVTLNSHLERRRGL